MSKYSHQIIPLVLSSLLLASCGGSSGGGSNTPDETTGSTANSADSGEQTVNPTGGNTETDSANGIPAVFTSDIDSTDNGNPLFYSTGNNSARLTGPVFGSGELSGTDVVEKIEIYGNMGNEAGYVVGAYAVRDTFGKPNARIILVTHNASDIAFCWSFFDTEVVNKDGKYLIQEGRSIPYGFGSNRYGSNFDFNNSNGDVDVDQCAAPNELIYGEVNLGSGIGDELLTDYGLAAGISEGNGPLGFPAGTPAEPVLPLSYTVNADGDVEVLIENQGVRTYEVSAKAYPLSPEGYPMISMYNTGGDSIVGPGESAVMVLPTTNFKGSSSTLRVVLELEQ